MSGNEWTIGTDSGPSNVDQDWMVFPASGLGMKLKGHTIDVSQHVPSTTAATAANGTILSDATPGFLDLGAKTITFKATDGAHTISFT